jgi:hypothetical protein
LPNFTRLRTFQRVLRTQRTQSLAGMKQAEAKRKEDLPYGHYFYEGSA